MDMVDAWYLRVGDDGPPFTAACASVLATDERRHMDRFRSARDRQLYGASRVLLRTLLEERTWQLHLCRPTAGHTLAVSVCRPEGGPGDIRLREPCLPTLT